jgi:hypothetical protein
MNWTDNFVFKEMALVYGALETTFESATHFVNELMASLTDEVGEESNDPIPRPNTVIETELVEGRLEGKNEEMVTLSYETTCVEPPLCTPKDTTTDKREPIPSGVRQTTEDPETHAVETHTVRPIMTARASTEETPAFRAKTIILMLPVLGVLELCATTESGA